MRSGRRRENATLVSVCPSAAGNRDGNVHGSSRPESQGHERRRDRGHDHDDAPEHDRRPEPAAVVVDLPLAARLLGIGRSSAYEFVRTGQWATPVIWAGRLIRVPTAPLLAALGLADRR
jgi:hypothetical protein